MSDSAITTIVSGVITVVITVVGFLTLWVKLKYGESKATEAAVKAEAAVAKATTVEDKIDDNTNITREVNHKADIITKQTNGSLDEVRLLAEAISERVSKLEDYNHNSAHRIIDAVNAVHLKLASLTCHLPAAGTDKSENS